MVDEDVAFGDLAKDVRVGLDVPEARVRHTGPRLVLQLRPVERYELHQRAAVEQSLGEIDLVAIDLQAALEPLAQARRDPGGDFDTHDLAEAPSAQLQLDRHPQIVRLVRDLVVRVARDAEHVLLDDLHLRKEPRREVGDDVFQCDEHSARAHADEPRQALRDLHAGDPLLASLFLPNEQHEAQRQRGDVRKRLSRPGGERCEHRVHLLLEASAQLSQLVGRAVVDGADDDAFVSEGRLEIVEPQSRLRALELYGPPADVDERLAHRSSVRQLACVAGVQLVHQAGHANAEELVEVRREDGAEPDALEERHSLVGGELEHPRVEVEPGQLSVEEAVGLPGELDLRQGYFDTASSL